MNSKKIILLIFSLLIFFIVCNIKINNSIPTTTKTIIYKNQPDVIVTHPHYNAYKAQYY